MLINRKIQQEIERIHAGDTQQLKVIFSEKPRVIVEAPAGYGKTTTMVSRIAYLYSCGLIPNPKRLLGLTFSVNAALKIKKDVAEKLPILLGDENNPMSIKDVVDITNYHGFCKKVLKKYGFLLTPLLKKDPNTFRAIGENEIEKDPAVKKLFLNEEIEYLTSIEAAIKHSQMPNEAALHKYANIIIDKLLSHDIITHTSLIIFTILLFDSYPEISHFYQNFYPAIVVDEFQDTNCVSWELIQRISTEKTKMLFLGDSLQRIYGFIGAVPNIMTIAEKKYGMEKIELNKNYRFMSNTEMLKLDHNVRMNALTKFTGKDMDLAEIPGFYGKNQIDECEQVCNAISRIACNNNTKVAVLFRGRGKNVDVMQKVMDDSKIKYFYGMFTDEDDEYVEFHKVCQIKFINRFGNKKTVSNYLLDKFSTSI